MYCFFIIIVIIWQSLTVVTSIAYVLAANCIWLSLDCEFLFTECVVLSHSLLPFTIVQVLGLNDCFIHFAVLA